MKLIASYQNDNGEKIEANLEVIQTYLVIYASGWESPTMLTGARASHNTGNAFKAVAEARHKINEKEHPADNCIIAYCSTDVEFFETINTYTDIVRLDVYSHGWLHGLNLGGFIGKRLIGGIEMDSDTIDWDASAQNSGRDLRRVDIHESTYMPGSLETNELVNIDSDKFSNKVEVYLWGCNVGGQLSRTGIHVGQNNKDGTVMIEDPKKSFAQYFALQIAKGSVYALVGKGYAGGSAFKLDEKGKNYFEDGEMLPANIVLNYRDIKKQPSKGLKANNYMKKFPL